MHLVSVADALKLLCLVVVAAATAAAFAVVT